MDASRFDYYLPPESIAQQALAQRDACKLLVVHREEKRLEHVLFKDIGNYLRPTDTLFRNAAKVLPARIFAHRPTGGQVECLLLKKETGDASDFDFRDSNTDKSQSESHSRHETWRCLLRPGKKLPPKSTFGIEGDFSAQVLEKNENGEFLVSFELPKDANVESLAERIGKMPLPPYIKRDRQDPRDSTDLSDYQTVYAISEKAVAAAAPTAGLHFTPSLENELKAGGITFHDLILHVGMGTFKPLDEGQVANHQIHTERYEIPVSVQKAYHQATSNGTRRICVGTTSVRSLEDYVRKGAPDEQTPFTEDADLFIYPPAQIHSTDALITNFHLPKSTLLCLVSAFLTPDSEEGIDWLLSIYQEAINREYRFLSYGDAMLIL